MELSVPTVETQCAPNKLTSAVKFTIITIASIITTFIDCVSQEPIKWQAFLSLAADTGCRRGELAGMQWKDVNWKKKTVMIRHNLQYSKAKKAGEDGVIYDGVYDVTPKGGKFRTVDLGDDTIEILTKYKYELTKPDEGERTIIQRTPHKTNEPGIKSTNTP